MVTTLHCHLGICVHTTAWVFKVCQFMCQQVGSVQNTKRSPTKKYSLFSHHALNTEMQWSLLGRCLTVLFMMNMNLYKSVTKLNYRIMCPYFWPWKWHLTLFVCWLLMCARHRTPGVVSYLTSNRETGRGEVSRKKIKKRMALNQH